MNVGKVECSHHFRVVTPKERPFTINATPKDRERDHVVTRGHPESHSTIRETIALAPRTVGP